MQIITGLLSFNINQVKPTQVYTYREKERKEVTIVYLAVPKETTSLRGLAFEALGCPKKGVALTTVLELAVAAIAMFSQRFRWQVLYDLVLGR